jgi:hypothetical protein
MSVSPGATGEITLTSRKEVLDRMRRLHMFAKDKEGREYYETTYDSKPIRFYLGYAVTIPLEWAYSLYGYDGYGQGTWMPMDEKCKQCKGTGAVPSGVCFVCKGIGWQDTNQRYRLYKLISQVDPLNFDTAELPQRNLAEPPKEVTSSLVG